jgi:hypothetical protein
MKTLILLSFFFTALLSGCAKKEDPNQNKVPQVFKENALELLLHTKTLADGRTVFQLEKNIFLKNKQEKHLIISSDTLPSLGTEVVNVADEEEEEARYNQVNKQYDVLFKVDSLRY